MSHFRPFAKSKNKPLQRRFYLKIACGILLFIFIAIVVLRETGAGIELADFANDVWGEKGPACRPNKADKSPSPVSSSNTDSQPIDIEIQGAALRRAIERCYASLPATTKSWLDRVLEPSSASPQVNISSLVEGYIPVGTPFDRANGILRAAGIQAKKPLDASFEQYRKDKNLRNYATLGFWEQRTFNPEGHMRLSTYLIPMKPADYSAVGKIIASLTKEVGYPTPPALYPFDVSDDLKPIDEKFRIVKERKAYVLELAFYFNGYDEYLELQKLVGVTGFKQTPDVAGQGITIPVHFVVSEISADGQERIIRDSTVETRGVFATGFFMERTLAVVDLPPGVYRLRAVALRKIPEFAGISTSLWVTYDERLQ